MDYTPAPSDAPLRRHASVARALILLGAVLLAALPPALLLLGEEGIPTGQADGLLGLPAMPLDTAARWRTALVSLLPVGGGLYALRQLWALFGEYREGRVFCAAAQQALVRFAWAVFGLSLALPLARALMSMAASLGNPPGQRFVTLSLFWHDGLHLLFGVVLLSIAHVMAQARRIADENAGFV
ncbi:MAG: DUF2975 domain-containing protein [Burkholderiaceae bacterium]|nr:MAG: DUF2975 domain-containing protein [Burkholderiaceae bacterium]